VKDFHPPNAIEVRSRPRQGGFFVFRLIARHSKGKRKATTAARAVQARLRSSTALARLTARPSVLRAVEVASIPDELFCSRLRAQLVRRLSDSGL